METFVGKIAMCQKYFSEARALVFICRKTDLSFRAMKGKPFEKKGVGFNGVIRSAPGSFSRGKPPNLIPDCQKLLISVAFQGGYERLVKYYTKK